MTLIERTCAPVEEDVKLLKELETKSSICVYLGTIKISDAYKDIYLVVMPDRSTHIIEIRRLCIDEKIVEQQ
ncbi:MAG: hypothetical protein QXK24_00845 [Ignisphaera sp.]|uniref:Uncharacterized protein n=1 Tax=Ignisphaera aggregans TaxID=334771 RepID=A0A7C4H1U2_9CREN